MKDSKWKKGERGPVNFFPNHKGGEGEKKAKVF